MRSKIRTAFWLGGRGVLVATEVGMLRAPRERGVTPDLIVGSSVGALNGAFFAAEPTLATVQRMGDAWTELLATASSLDPSSHNYARWPATAHICIPTTSFGAYSKMDWRVKTLRPGGPFRMFAASIERAAPHWFSTGSDVDAVLASGAVPGLPPTVEIAGGRFFDDGLNRSVPIGRVVEFGASPSSGCIVQFATLCALQS
jgi:NTE family protein